MFSGNNFSTSVCVIQAYMKMDVGSVGDGRTKLKTTDMVVTLLVSQV